MRLKTLLEERAHIWDQMSEIRERSTSEGRDFTAEERASWDKGEADLSAKTVEIEREQRAESIAKTLAGVEVERPAEVREDKATEYREAFVEWARNGSRDLDARAREVLRDGFMDTRALGVASGGVGGYTVPQGFRDVLVETMKYYNAMRQVATIISTDSGNTLPWPVNNDTANVGAILAENTQIANQDVAFTQEQLGAYAYTSKLVPVAIQLLQDTAIDIESFLARKLGQRIGRIQNQHFTTGTGTAQPTGVITGATSVNTAAVGSTVLIKYADLVATKFKLDPAYRNGGNVNWMWSDTALATIRQLVDSQGRPLWEPSLQAGLPDQLLGFGIKINNDLAVPAANAKSGILGDFAQGYVIRDVQAVQTVRLDERYADYLQVGWFAYQRSDATVQDTAAMVVFQQSAT